MEDRSTIDEEGRPPLSPRRSTSAAYRHLDAAPTSSSLPRPTQSRVTTAVSLTDVMTTPVNEDLVLEARVSHRSHPGSSMLGDDLREAAQATTQALHSTTRDEDNSSILSLEKQLREPSDLDSLCFDEPEPERTTLEAPSSIAGIEQKIWQDIQGTRKTMFHEEFGIDHAVTIRDGVTGVPPTWLSKRKQFLILSKAGKPIYSRHGTAEELSVNLGVMHTIIASYESSSDSLQSFAMGDCTCVVLSRGPVLLIAFSRLDETESQISNQLEALYNQILSTLTLPRLEQIFSNRASTDLRKHLKGTESLLDGLSDSFTRGSPASLLSALECLKLKKTHRHLINNTLLRAKTHSLLYGLIVAQGKLVSVLRPRRHSLHPGDLHLVFNMLFEADGIKKDLDENWIPLCLPAFNPNGFVYAYVGFAYDNSHQRSMGSADLEWEEDVALILISANRDSFFELQKMKRAVVTDLRQNGGLDSIRSAIIEGRPSITKIDPGSLSRHFLYKSRANVQYLASDYNSHFLLPWNRRKLYDLYHQLHGDLHSKHNRSKVLHRTAFECTSLAWMSASFELYLIAESGVSKATLGQSAAKIVQWAQSQEERLFIVGGAIF